MQRISEINHVIRVQVKPSLSAFFFGARIPSNTQHLQTPVGKRDQILLQGIDTPNVYVISYC